MMFSDEKFGRYAMQAEALTQENRWYLDVEDVGRSLGFSTHESREFAYLLENEGWVQLTNSDPPKLRLTLKGIREVALLRGPRWRRWLEKNTAVAAIVISLCAVAISFVSSIVALLSFFLK